MPPYLKNMPFSLKYPELASGHGARGRAHVCGSNSEGVGRAYGSGGLRISRLAPIDAEPASAQLIFRAMSRAAHASDRSAITR
jgi:hypothetical protein